MVGDVVDDDVIPLGPAGEVVAGVVDDRVGAERGDQAGVAGTAHPGAERLGDLDREAADAAARLA